MVFTDVVRAGTTNCWPLGARNCSYAGGVAIGCNLDAVVASAKSRSADFNLSLRPKRAVFSKMRKMTSVELRDNFS